MVTVIDGKLMFGRDQVVTSTQAGKNFGEMKRRASESPVFVADRNEGIDTVIVSFDEFEQMAVELDALRREKLYATAAERIDRAAADPDHVPIALQEAMGEEEYEQFLTIDPDDPNDVSDEKLFE